MNFRWMAICAALALSACGTMKPSLNYKAMNLQQVDFEGATLDLVYALKNPNPIGGTLSHVKYSLQVEGKNVVSGQPSKGVTVPASGSSDLHFPARIKFADIFPAVTTVFTKGSANYTARGEVGFKTPLGVIALPISKSAAFSLPKGPSFSMESPKIENISLTGARLTIPLKIANGNAFALVASGLTGAVSIGGNKVGATSVSLSNLPASGAQTIQLPIDIDFLKSGMAVANLLKGGSAQVKLEGDFKSGNTAIPVNLSQLLNFIK